MAALRADGTTTKVALEARVSSIDWDITCALLNSKRPALSRLPTITDNIERVFPSPTSSASIPPGTSSLVALIEPVILCLYL